MSVERRDDKGEVSFTQKKQSEKKERNEILLSRSASSRLLALFPKTPLVPSLSNPIKDARRDDCVRGARRRVRGS